MKNLLIILGFLAFASDTTFAETPDKTLTHAEDDLLHAADTIAVQVAKIRGLELKGEIKKGIKERDHLRAVLLQKLSEEVSDDQIAAEGKVYQRLGLVPRDLDYKKMLLDVLTEQIAGFYDQKTKELYVMRGIPMTLQRPAMAHELFHAIQDQHFDIEKLQDPFSTIENGDYALARSALLEGDATIVMFDFSLYESGNLPQDGVTSVVDIPLVAGMLKELSFDQLTALEQLTGTTPGAQSLSGSALADAPAVFRELLMFPYFAGMRFVVSARIGNTWKDIDQIYQNPPSSTEHILHPEKYFAQDEPVYLEFEVASVLKDYRPIYDTVMGEFMARLYFKAHLGVEDSRYLTASAGWGGDRILAFEKDGSVISVHVSTFDSWRDAEEYRDATVAATRARFPDHKVSETRGTNGEAFCILNDQERIYIERWGDLVLHIEGAPTAIVDGVETDRTTENIRNAVYNSLTRQPLSQAIAERRAK